MRIFGEATFSKGKHEVTLSVDEIPATEEDSRSLAITGLGEPEWVLYDSADQLQPRYVHQYQPSRI